MVADMIKVMTKLKPWIQSNGYVRWYVNDWKEIIGLKAEHYKSGRYHMVKYTGESEHYYNRFVVENTKVWFDEIGEIHVDCHTDWLKEEIKKKVSEAFQ